MGVLGKVTERLSDIRRLTSEISFCINTVLTEVQQNECVMNTSFGTERQLV
jgi:hypothetical protein